MIALRRTLAVAGAATLAAALTPVASAQAPPPTPAPARFVVPGPGQTVSVSNPTIHAFVSTLGTGKIFVTVAGPVTVTREVTATSTCQEVRETVPLPVNGSYEVKVTADAPAPAPLATDKSCQGGTPDPRQFFVAAPPKPPSGVKAAMEGRAANVSWAKNPESDIVSYRIQRSDGAGPFKQVGEVPGTSFKDGSVPPGSLRYRVLAVRRGAKPGEVLVSAPSAAVTITLGGTVGAGSRGGGGSGRSSGASKPVFTGPPQPGGAGAAASEEGFDERLPYTAADEEEPRELGAEETSNSSHRSLAFIAGGLLVLAVYMHLWWLKRQAEQPLSA